MSKSINVHEACIITKDDKGNLSLVGKAKEALTSLQKNQVSVHVILCENKKDDVEKFLTNNNVPFASIITKEEAKKEKEDKKTEPEATVVPSSKFVTFDGDWQYCLDRIVKRLWGEKEKEAPKSEQTRMDEAMKRYIEWAKPKKPSDNGIMPG